MLYFSKSVWRFVVQISVYKFWDISSRFYIIGYHFSLISFCSASKVRLLLGEIIEWYSWSYLICIQQWTVILLMKNVQYRLTYLITGSLVIGGVLKGCEIGGGTLLIIGSLVIGGILRGCEIFRRWSLAGGRKLLERALNSCRHYTLFVLCILYSNQTFAFTSSSHIHDRSPLLLEVFLLEMEGPFLSTSYNWSWYFFTNTGGAKIRCTI